MGAEDLGAIKDRSVYCKCPRLSRGLQRSALIGIRGIFHAESPSWWHQLAPKWWPSRTVFCVCRGIILLTTSLFFLIAGFPPGSWLCCCATNPMHITTSGDGTRHLWLPRNVSSGIQPMWRYGAVMGVAAVSFFLTCHLPSLLYKRGMLLFQLSLHFKCP